MFRKYGLIALAAAAFTFAATVPAIADGSLALKAPQAYNFTRSVVTKIGDPNADLSFSVGGDKTVVLAANRIKGFGPSAPGPAAFNGIKSWPGSVSAPAPGYFVVQGHDGRTVYLVQVTNVDNQGKAGSLEAFWEKLW